MTYIMNDNDEMRHLMIYIQNGIKILLRMHIKKRTEYLLIIFMHSQN